MPKVVSVGICPPPHVLNQDTVVEFAKELFSDAYRDINRLLQVFENGQVEKRHFVNDMAWFRQDHSFEERNDTYIEQAKQLGAKAIETCLMNQAFLRRPVEAGEIDAFFFISSTGIATPSVDARIMNMLPFSPHAKRIPIWGLGCAGGAAGLSRAFEYCRAFPAAKVLVLAVELCSLTFQRNDLSKSNLIGTSLFADGVAAVLVAGDEADVAALSALPVLPAYMDSQSTLMPDSEGVMGWDVKSNGLYVVFSKDIPAIIRGWLRPNVESFLERHGLAMTDVPHFIAHPGGKKVLEAYQAALGVRPEQTGISFDVLREYGNMSSATVLYVLERYMQQVKQAGEAGIVAALGPGFSSELILVRWEEVR
ncbi:type III polyketide synthase [Ectobacillus ponti]|uniref:Type III polyketide synthase n=1 Tax=Ectobacillus ponti TaxID=2961894 RepID=A0AA41X8G7_9BACI|nr:3-oxoacyl-[acyl-carrier-protein] synthase III C-terminal domain-containing protein [Ectobacillus ponti]MCP8968810.1 type III polyketide synthase [Ectobacillus ponti]